MLTVDKFINKNTGEVVMVDKATGRVFKNTPPPGLQGWNDMFGDGIQAGNDAAAAQGETKWWQSLLNTAEEIYNSDAFQQIAANISFSDGQIQWGSGGSGGDVTTPGGPTDSGGGYNNNGGNNQASGIPKELYIVGGVIVVGALLWIAASSADKKKD